MNRRILERATAVIVHSRAPADRIASRPIPGSPARSASPRSAAEPRPVAPRRAAGGPACPRARRPSSFVVGAVGILHPTKLNCETIRAFAVLLANPDATLLFLGRDLGGGEARREAERLGVADRVRFLGHLPDADYERAIARDRPRHRPPPAADERRELGLPARPAPPRPADGRLSTSAPSPSCPATPSSSSAGPTPTAGPPPSPTSSASSRPTPIGEGRSGGMRSDMSSENTRGTACSRPTGSSASGGGRRPIRGSRFPRSSCRRPETASVDFWRAGLGLPPGI